MAGSAADVLFIHPYNHAKPDPIPVGTVAAVNLLPRPVLGRYAEEVSPDEIAAARVVLLDLHWFLPIAVLEGILRAIRSINRRAVIVVGGLTASFYKRAFLERYDVDYLIAGDAEEALPPLVASLRAGEVPPPIDNVWTRTHAPPGSRTTGRADFDALDWLTLDWFPTYRERIERVHAEYARAGGSTLADSCHPILPLTRGCRRSCHFCYGAYQREVFGPRVRMRSPAAVRQDLERIAADPALHFVSLFFADAVYFEAYARALTGCALELDAFLFFCGAVTPEALEGVRSVFRGNVIFTIIQPPDLAPLRSDPPAADQSAKFEGMMAHFGAMERARAVVFQVESPLLPSVTDAARAGVPVSSLLAQDWSIIRPDANALRGDQGHAQQLAEVEAAARKLAAAQVLRLLVPAIGRIAVPSPLELGDLVHLLETGNADEMERHILQLLVRQILERRVYGFDDLVLGWTAQPATSSFDTGWLPAGRALDGRCAWYAGLNGFGWEGEVEVDDAGPLALAPAPTVLVEGQAPVAIASWARARLPALRVEPGPRRRLRIGGDSRGGGLELWCEDRGNRTARRLAPDLPEAPPLRGEELPTDPWPSPTWPDAVARAATERFAGRWQLVSHAIGPARLDLRFGSSGESVVVTVFVRKPDFLGAGRFSYAYRKADEERFLSHVAPELLALLEAVDAALPRDPTKARD